MRKSLFASAMSALTVISISPFALLAQQSPTMGIEGSVLITWSEEGNEEYIVVGAETSGGPDVPVLEPIFSRHGELGVAMPITCGLEVLKHEEYFKLVPGYQLIDDFNDPGLIWPTMCFPDPRQFEVNHVDGTLQIVAQTAGAYSRAVAAPFALPQRQSFVHANFAMSVDILDWDLAAADQSFGLVARASTPSDDCSQVLESLVYMGLVQPQRGRLSIYANPPNEVLRYDEFVYDPEKAYRLVFTGVGNRLRLRLFGLDDLTLPLAEVVVINSNLSRGFPALWANANTGALDITVDNYFVSGARPSQ
jgi:hypothetical protein